VFEPRQTSATTTLSVVVVHAVLIIAALGSSHRRAAPLPAPAVPDTTYWVPAPVTPPPLRAVLGRLAVPTPPIDPPVVPLPGGGPIVVSLGQSPREWLAAFRADSSGARASDSSGSEPAPYWADSPEVLAAGPRRYPERLRLAGVEGHVVIEAVLDTTGRIQPQSLIVIASSHPEFDGPAAAYVRQTLFRPARVNGRAVSARIRLPVDFVLRR
jgi:TonB family protein